MSGKNSSVVRRPLSVAGRRRAANNEQRTTDNGQKGFSLLELVIAMFILIILLSVAVPTYRYTVQQAKETVLKENIRQIENAIQQYAIDKGKLPQSVDELVEAKYLREIPVDPMTEKAEWEPVMGEDEFSGNGDQGMVEVKSLAEGEDSAGKPYKEY